MEIRVYKGLMDDEGHIMSGPCTRLTFSKPQPISPRLLNLLLKKVKERK